MRAGAVRIHPASRPHEGLNLKYVLLGVITSLVLAVIFSGIVGALFFLGWLSEIHSPLVMTVVSFFCLFLGGAYAGRRAGRAGWAHGGLTGISCITLMIIVGLLIYDQLAPVLVLAQRFVVGAALGALGGTVGINVRPHR